MTNAQPIEIGLTADSAIPLGDDLFRGIATLIVGSGSAIPIDLGQLTTCHWRQLVALKLNGSDFLRLQHMLPLISMDQKS
jgi:hypothetical protein